MDGEYRFPLMVQPVSPKSPPGGLDLFGKRRQLVKVQVLEREIGLLKEELKSIEALQPASRCCKELDEFLGAKPDPLVAKAQEIQKSNTFWKRLGRRFCSKLLRIFCFCHCRLQVGAPSCCYTCCLIFNTRRSPCAEKMTCLEFCRSRVSFTNCSSSCFNWIFCKCREVNPCHPNCAKNCRNPCCLQS